MSEAAEDLEGAKPADTAAVHATEAMIAAQDAIASARLEITKTYSGEPKWTFKDGTNPLQAVFDGLSDSLADHVRHSMRRLSAAEAEVTRHKLQALEERHTVQLEKVRAKAAGGHPAIKLHASPLSSPASAIIPLLLRGICAALTCRLLGVAARMERNAAEIAEAAAREYDRKLLALASDKGACDAALADRLAEQTRELARAAAAADELADATRALDEAESELRASRRDQATLQEAVHVSEVCSACA